MSETLPAGWATARLAEIAEIQLGKMLDKKKNKGKRLRYLRNVNVRWDRIDTSDLLEMCFQDHELERYSIRSGDVLVCEGGEPGRAAVWDDGDTDIKYQKALHRVRLLGGIKPRWLVHHLRLDASRGRLAVQFTGTTISHLTREAICEYALRIPPLPEQVRIIDSLDSYLTRLDEVVAGLERVQRNLRRYRASVLQAAVEGRLVPTEAELARAEGRDYEPASVLLERILVERRRRWDAAELRRLCAAGKEPTDDRWKAKYRVPAAPDTNELPQVPEGWCWASVESISTKVVDGVHKKPDYVEQGVPFVTVRNLTAGPQISFEQLKYISDKDHAEFVKRTDPERGDLLLSKDGTLGVVRVVRTDRRFSIFVSVALVKPVLPDLTDYLELALSSPMVQAQMVPKGSGLQHIHLEDLRRDCIPLPPASEAGRIVEAARRHVSLIESLEAEIRSAEARIRNLRQSILFWAFEGKLVDQDPADEPASQLLKRIRGVQEIAADETRPSLKRTRRRTHE